MGTVAEPVGRPADTPPPDGAPVTPGPRTPEPRSPAPEGRVTGKDEPGDGTSPDPRTPYGPDKGPPVGEAAGEDGETQPPTP